LITRFWPRGKKKDFVDLWDPDLGPSKELLVAFKNGKVTWEQYDQRYRKERQTSWGQEAIERLKQIQKKKKVICLLCYERNGDPHCHRYILKEIIQ
jgi:uncharacterized protein YeaO (DUF488 family)